MRMMTIGERAGKLTRDEAELLDRYADGVPMDVLASEMQSRFDDVERTITALVSNNRNLARSLVAEWEKSHGDANPESSDTIAALISRAVQTGQARLVTAADRISDLVEELEAQLKAYEAERSLREEQERLEARLAEIREQLGVKRRSGSAVDSKAVRAWAKENGVECPALGRVPAAVVEAFNQAQAGPSVAGDERG